MALWVTGLFALGIVLLASLQLPAIRRQAVEQKAKALDQAKCWSNLRQIGLAAVIYAETNDGQLPPDLATIYLTQDIQLGSFVCPHSNALPANDLPLTLGQTCSYLWLGHSAEPKAVVAVELLENHDGDGGNVLHADASVKWLEAAPYRKLIDSLAADGRLTPAERDALAED